MLGVSKSFRSVENFKSNNKIVDNNSTKEKQAKEDIYMKWPLRGLAYSNELGEIVRPMSGLVANLLWIPAIGYIAADVGDKYKHNRYGEVEPSKKRAGKQLSFQMLASVILSTAAVKAGQKITNIISSKGKTKLSINDREKYTRMITQSMNKGSHEKFINEATGFVDREKYTQHIMENIAEMDKHKKTRNKMFSPIAGIIDFIKKPFESKPKTENIQKYVSSTISDIMYTRDFLIQGHKPKNISDKLYKAFEKEAKNGTLEQKKSAAYTVVRKMQGKKLFKNNAIKSLGGLISLAVMMKPIDNFVENVLIHKYIGPTIDKMQKPWKSLQEVAKESS